MSKKSHNMSNEFRVIGGEWRSRRLSLAPNAQLRPTPDRVRETLFNWLGYSVIKARCLDLFAGSGALGIEALSRGAEHCDFVESNKSAAQQIKANLDILNVSKPQADVYAKPANEFLKNLESGRYDIIFLDPPFHLNMLESLISKLCLCAREGSYIYIEIEKSGALPALPDNWSVIREKTAGQVRYHLVLVN